MSCVSTNPAVLMEGALGERLKREYRLQLDDHITLAGFAHTDEGRVALRALWTEYADIAHEYQLPLLACTPTRRASRDRVAASAFSEDIIAENVALLQGVQIASAATMFVGGLMGCRADAYSANDALPASEARSFHYWQAELFAQAGADFLFAGIMPALPEAIGMAQAMSDSGLPYIISFMIRGDGRLLDDTTIHDAITAIDASAEQPPTGYMTNCVHPGVLHDALLQPFNQTPLVRERFKGIQANAARQPLTEIDGADELHTSEPTELATEMMRLRDEMGLTIFGGCCGTDDSHVREIARRLREVRTRDLPV